MADPQATFAANLSTLGIDIGNGDDKAYMLRNDGRDQELSGFMCSVCGQALQRLHGIDGKPSLIHVRSWVDYDHDPDPVEVPAGSQPSRLCDFCGVEEPTHWHLKGDRLIRHIGNLVHDYGGTWGACETCGGLLQRNDLEALLDRFMETSSTVSSKEQIRVVRLSTLTEWLGYLRTVTEMVYVGPRPGPAKMTPQMMPKLQAGLVKFWNSENLKLGVCSESKTWYTTLPTFVCGDAGTPAFEDFTRVFEPGVAVPEAAWDKQVKHLTAGIWGSELYWISSKFTQLAIMAGKDFENPALFREDLPSECGLLVWQDSVGEIARVDSDYGGAAAIRAISWTVIPDGIWISFYVQPEDADPSVDIANVRQHLGWLISPNTGGGTRFGEIDLKDVEFRAIRTFLATLFLINQPGVADMTTAPVDKREARRYQRNHHRPQPLIRLINLRKQPDRSSTAETGPRGPINFRVYRKGHWKQQPYGPKRGLRRHIYVSGYIAGPDGAPLRPPKANVKVLK